jgi:hypothetical protein
MKRKRKRNSEKKMGKWERKRGKKRKKKETKRRVRKEWQHMKIEFDHSHLLTLLLLSISLHIMRESPFQYSSLPLFDSLY